MTRYSIPLHSIPQEEAFNIPENLLGSKTLCCCSHGKESTSYNQ